MERAGDWMEEQNDVKITSYDRLMRAWENSMELTRDFEVYAKRVDDEELKQVFRIRRGRRFSRLQVQGAASGAAEFPHTLSTQQTKAKLFPRILFTRDLQKRSCHSEDYEEPNNNIRSAARR